MAPAESAPASFELVPPSPGARFTLWLLCLVLPLAVTAVALGIAFDATSSRGLNLVGGSIALTFGLAMALVAAVTVPLAIWLGRALRRFSVLLQDGVLELRAAWYLERVPVQALDLGRSRVVRWDEHTQYRPMLKTNAIGLPGYLAGHFRLRDWRTRAFCIVTARDRLLVLHERDGRVILLSLRQPQRLLDALHQVFAASASRR